MRFAASADSTEDAPCEGGWKDCWKKLVVLGATLVISASVGTTIISQIKPKTMERKKLLPFLKRHDGIELSAKQAMQVDAGEKVMLAKREVGAGGGRGTAVCDVAAPPKYVWETVLDFEHYEGRLAACKRSRVYEKSRNLVQRTETIKVHMILDAVVKEFNCYYDHTWRPDKSVLTWTLDPEKKSDFYDVQGQWCVDKHPTKPNWSRVWYSADIALPPWLPRMVVIQLCKKSGIKALNFAKKDAEANYIRKHPPRAPGSSRLRPPWAFAAAKKGGFRRSSWRP